MLEQRRHLQPAEEGRVGGDRRLARRKRVAEIVDVAENDALRVDDDASVGERRRRVALDRLPPVAAEREADDVPLVVADDDRVALRAAEGEELVLVPRRGDGRVPGEVLPVEDRPAEEQLEPLVAHRAEVVELRRGAAYRRRQELRDESV